jgi:DNA-binding CsgD family transcriptional regulator
MLRDSDLSVFDAKSRDELYRGCLRFTRQLGFSTFASAAVIDHFVGNATAFVSVDNTPPAFQATSNDAALARRDPVMQHCKRRSIPLAWDQSTYVDAGQADLWEHQAQHGYRCGLIMAMHLPNGRHFVFGVDRDQALPKDQKKVSEMVAALLMFGTYAQDATMRILLSDVPPEDGPRLTRRELETLRWTLEGKTAWEIGRILSIAEDTVARHAHNATQKLDCANKHHAVRALRLGLIQ